MFEHQKALTLPRLPRTIGVVTGERGKARDDVLAGLRRRGWAGRLVWAFAPVQDRHAAPRITQALQDLAAIEEIEVVIVARGGGSLADLFAFCASLYEALFGQLTFRGSSPTALTRAQLEGKAVAPPAASARASTSEPATN